MMATTYDDGGHLMKLLKKLGLFVVTGAMALGVGLSLETKNDNEVNAADSLYKTCDFTLISSNSSAYNSTWDYGTDWTVFGAANNNGSWAYLRFGGKSATLATSNPTYVYNKNAMGSAISKIRVSLLVGTLSKTGMAVTKWGVKVYSDSLLTTLIDDSYLSGLSVPTVAISYDFAPSAAYQSANSTIEWPTSSYFQVYFDCTNTTTTNGIVYVDKVFFYRDVTAVAVTSVTFDEPESTTFSIGDTLTLNAVVLPVEATDKSLVWESDDESVIEVDQTGKLTAISVGTAIISATSVQNPSILDYIEIEVLGTPSSYDKTFTATDFGMLSTYVDGNYSDDGIVYYAYQVMKSTNTATFNSLQFRGSPSGYLYNKTAYASNISKISVKLSAGNTANTYAIYVGSSSNPDSTVTVTGVADPNSALYVDFDVSALGNYKYFKITRTSTDYTVYIDGISVQMVNTDVEAARTYAASFLSTLDSECQALNVSSATWTTLSGNYNALSEAAKVAFTGEESTVVVTTIQRALERYVYIVNKYGYTNFMGIAVSPSSNVDGLKTNLNDALSSVIIISLVGVSLLGGMFFLKRKREE